MNSPEITFLKCLTSLQFNDTNLEEREEGGLAGAYDALDVDGEGAAAAAVEVRAQLGEFEGGKLPLVVRDNLILIGVPERLMERILSPSLLYKYFCGKVHILLLPFIKLFSTFWGSEGNTLSCRMGNSISLGMLGMSTIWHKITKFVAGHLKCKRGTLMYCPQFSNETEFHTRRLSLMTDADATWMPISIAAAIGATAINAISTAGQTWTD